MSSSVEKSLLLLQFLADYPDGVPLAQIADEMNLTRSGCHRLLGELTRFGFVRQTRMHGDYALTTKLAALGLSYLSKSGVVDIAQPLLEQLAESTKELARLAIVDGERLTLVAKAQGSRSALKYDPDMGTDLQLSCSAAGHAWLMTMPEDEALEIVARQGFGKSPDFGPNAPKGASGLLKMLREHRKRGFSLVRDMFTPWMSAIAAPVRSRSGAVVGLVIVAGPSVRLSEQKLLEMGPALLATASELAQATSASALFPKATLSGEVQTLPASRRAAAGLRKKSHTLRG